MDCLETITQLHTPVVRHRSDLSKIQPESSPKATMTVCWLCRLIDLSHACLQRQQHQLGAVGGVYFEQDV